MNSCFKLIFSVFFLSFVNIVFGQTLPVDPTIKVGKLENGLTYYLRSNKEPKERASFYIIQNVGSVLENDNQDGLAHFLEHMAFNGTKNFPGKGVLNMLAKNGVEFGRNVNAYTSFEETVYNISDVPIKNPGLLDSCILILHDWADGLQLQEAEIDAERGVITEEYRTRRNAGWRLREQYFPTLLNGSKHSQRDIIGKLDVIQNFKPDLIKKFYHDWYRTDLQAIAIVGDFDVAEVEQKIIETLGTIKAIDNPQPRQKYEIPYHTGTKFVVATDKEATSHNITIYNKHASDESASSSINGFRDRLAIQLFNRMMGDRISELVQKGNPPFITGGINYGKFLRGYDMMTISANAHPNRMEEALTAIYTEALRVKNNMFTAGELDRAKQNLISQLETRVKQKDKIQNDQFCRSIVPHFLENSPLISIEDNFELTNALLPTLSVEEVSKLIGKWMSNDNRVIVIQGPTDAQLLSEAEVLSIIKKVENSKIEAYKDEVVATSLLNKEPKGGKIINTTQLPQFNAVEWTLSNNAKVIYRHADYQKDNVLIRSISPGGSSLYGADVLASSEMLPVFIGNFGLGDFDAIALKKVMTGKNVNISPSVSEFSESLSGSSTPKDIETAFQMLYLYFTQPRFEADAFNALKSRYLAFIDNLSKNPEKIMSDTTQLITSNYSPRTVLLDKETLEKINVADMEKIYKERFMDAGDFTFFIVGNIEENLAKSLTEKYIGSIADNPRKENWKDNKVRMPKGKTQKQVFIPLETEKANVSITYETPLLYEPKSNLHLDILIAILDLRYTEEIREKEGGTYGVSVYGGSNNKPIDHKNLVINFDTDEAKVDKLD
jgi:zinc protease